MRFFVLVLAAVALAGPVRAATQPAEQLLPSDTLAVFSVPDWDKAAAYVKASPQGRLWQQPALRAFRERFIQRWKEDFAEPLERELGVKLADYAELFHGQVTVAITPNGWGSNPEAIPGVLLLIDTKDKADLLKTRLAELKKKWIEAGKQLKTDKVRDVDLTTFMVSEGELSKTLKKALPAPGHDKDEDEDEERAPGKADRLELTVGSSGPLLIVGTTTRDVERILARQTGGIGPALAEQAVYESSQPVFRDALGIGWINFARVYETFAKQFKASNKSSGAGSPFSPRTDQLLAATGLAGLKTIAAKFSGDAEGTAAEVFLAVPESRRQGVFRLLAAERKESGPPAFVGFDVVKFGRWRLDGQKAWNTLEKMLTSASPELSGVLQMALSAAGKDKDPDFDMRATLVGSLGDDFISLEKAPRSSSLAEVNSPPSLFLIGSPAAEQLLQGLRAATSLMPLAGGEPSLKEREFLGRKIYSLGLSPAQGDDDGPSAFAGRTFNFAASGSYAALSTDNALIEHYLRSGETSEKSLRELPGLAEAAQKVGGMNTGLFGYQNHSEMVRLWPESTKKENAALEKILSLLPGAGGKAARGNEGKTAKVWFDVSLLPPFEQISSYFYFLVYSLSSSDAGFTWKLFAPAPPRLK